VSGALTGIERVFGRSFPDPGPAAAVAILYARPVSQPPLSGLDRGLAAVAPHLSDAERTGWIVALTGPLRKFAISAPRCLAAFLGQCAVESGGFLGLEENLSYSAGRLCQVWPNRFSTIAVAEACAFQPEVLANRVYADRMGNGGVLSGDGWRFRGRGLIQLSGRANYERFAAAINLGLGETVQHAATQIGAAESAAWFWSVNGLNELAATWSIDLITRKINGGTAGAADRSRLCDAALRAIGD
jgi:putative chitinase